jgi:hypothetical protein
MAFVIKISIASDILPAGYKPASVHARQVGRSILRRIHPSDYSGEGLAGI